MPWGYKNTQRGDIDLEYGVSMFRGPTKSNKHKDPKVIRIRLLDFYIDEFKKLKKQYPALDSVRFFRCPDGFPFGKNYSYRN